MNCLVECVCVFVCKGVRGRKFGRGLPLDSQRRLFFKEVRLWWAAVWLSGIAGNMLLGTKILSLSHFFYKRIYICRTANSVFTTQKPSAAHFWLDLQ